jgi:nitrilase
MVSRTGQEDVMDASEDILEVAVVQAGSLVFDGPGCVEKACHLIGEAGSMGARLVLLPEAFIGGYPRGLSFGTVVGNRSPEGRELWARYHAASLEIPGPGMEQLSAAAAAAKVYVAVGVIERDAGRAGTIYCSLLYFAPDGAFLGRHRKLKPTASERLVWGEGDASGLISLDTPYGRVGGLICWENYMPLARAAMYRQGLGIYLAPTADARPVWQATMVHIALEARAFVLGCNQFFTKAMYPVDLLRQPEFRGLPDLLCEGGSVIVSPLGEVIAGPLWGEEGILRARLNLRDIVRARFDFDAIGHYARPDVFRFDVPGMPEPVRCGELGTAHTSEVAASAKHVPTSSQVTDSSGTGEEKRSSPLPMTSQVGFRG